MSTIKVNRIENTSTTDGGVSIDVDGHVTIDGQQLPTTGPLSNRNVIINGAMRVAQRGTSSNSSGYHTIDRFLIAMDGGTFSQSQEDVSISDLPYTNDGISKFARITNTTAPPNTTGFRGIRYSFESQDLYNSGWQYQNSNSFITVSFWVRASVSQKFYASLETTNGTAQKYVWGFTPAANTWTKITKIIPGSASVSLNNDANLGAYLNIAAFWGTNFTDSGVSEDAWEAWLTGTRFPDFSTTWKDTAGATFEITGVQLEVGSKVTPFEHESYGQTLAKCQRYYYEVFTSENNLESFGAGSVWTSSSVYFSVNFPVTMRAYPSFSGFTAGNGPGYLVIYSTGVAAWTNDSNSILATQRLGINGAALYTTYFVSTTNGIGGSVITFTPGNGAWVEKYSPNLRANFSAEL